MITTIPYGRQDISSDDLKAVIEVMQSDFLTQGPAVPAFEEAIASYCGASYGVAVSSATAALHIACRALEVGPGDIVWTSPVTFVASANCAIYCGATIDFVDIDPNSYNMSVVAYQEKLEEAAKQGKLPKVVIPVHLCGQSCEMAEIWALSQKYGVKVIEDASHGIGGNYCSKPVGGCLFSDITVFSFHPVKIITTAEGGLSATNDAVLAKKMRLFRSHGIVSDLQRMEARPPAEIWNYQQIDLGFNYRITDIQAALGSSQMKRLDSFVQRRREIAARYDMELQGAPIKLPWQHGDTQSSYHLYPIRLKLDKIDATQKEVYKELRNSGILVNLHYIPVYLQPFFAKMGFCRGYCPEAEAYFSETISIPIYSGLSDDDQTRVIESVQDVVK